MAALKIILGSFYAIGLGLSVIGIFNLLSAFGIVNIFPSLYGFVEVDGDITTGWVLLSIGIFVVLSAAAIGKKWKIDLFD